jgi:hypothetical protein
MSNLIIISAAMHKIANVEVDVKYRYPGNVIEYISMTFEVYKNRCKFFAIPLANEENRRLANLPNEFSFRLEGEVIYISARGLEEVVEQIVDKLQSLGLIKRCQNNNSKKKRVSLVEQLQFS